MPEAVWSTWKEQHIDPGVEQLTVAGLTRKRLEKGEGRVDKRWAHRGELHFLKEVLY